MKEIDLGYSYDDEVPQVDRDNKVYYPEFHIEGMDANLGKGVGSDFTAKVKLCLTSVRKNKDGKYCYGIEVKAIMPEEGEDKSFGELLEDLAEGE